MGNPAASNSLVELATRQIRLARQPAEKPCARRLARWQAVHGNYGTNLRHEPVTLGAFERQIIRHLDGHHTRSALLRMLGEYISRGELSVQHEGEVVKDGRTVESLLQQALEEQLL